MRPIKLKISGLNSYIDEQVIDFEKLTERGLFGIFGQTGSGKSTILDAMTIAMYGNIPRNTKEFINSASDRASISYEFEIGGQNTRRRYIVDRTIKRTKTGGILTSHCRLVEIHNDSQSTVLADKATDVNKKIAEVVGLTVDDFTRSVVLPQGKFNDFLKLTGADRRNMLERIFGLEKYGKFLIEKVRQRKSEQNKNLLVLNTKLSGFEGISEEEYEKASNELEEINKKEKLHKKTLEETQVKYEEYKEIYENQLELEKYKARKKELDLKSTQIKEKEVQLDLAFRAEKINPYIETIHSLEKSINKDKISINEIEKKLNIEIQELSVLKKQYEEIKTKKDNELPKLSERKVKIERAIELENQVSILDIELKTLRVNRSKLIRDHAILPECGKPKASGTVYMCAADNEGNMISFIQSNYRGFGSGVVVPGTGIGLQNRGEGFSLDPNHPNFAAPGKKPYHTIIPGFLTKGNEAVGPFGVMGGFMQPQGHMQVMLDYIDKGMNPQACLDAPRWQWTEGMKVSFEPAFPEYMVEALKARGHNISIDLNPGSFGRGQIIFNTGKGTLMGATEPRCEGAVQAW